MATASNKSFSGWQSLQNPDDGKEMVWLNFLTWLPTLEYSDEHIQLAN
jgi:hypothetical protein